MAAIGNLRIAAGDSRLSSPPRGILKPSRKHLAIASSSNLSFTPTRQSKTKAASSRRSTVVHAGFREGGRPSSASAFVGGFVLGGIIMGALGCVYAPQISKALAGADKKDMMKKLPKFIYDEDKALEKTRKVLAEKIAQLNSAIDDVSSHLQEDEGPNGVAVASDEVEAAM